DPLLEHLEALTRIQLSVLRLLNIIKDLPTKEIGELAGKFKDFKGAPFKVPLKARWQPPPKKKYGKANQRGKISAEIAKRAADVAVRELQKERQEEAWKQKEQVLSGGVDLSQFLIQNKEPADEVDMNIKEDKQQPFNKPSVLYNEVLGGLEDKVVILEAGENDNSWLNNAESRHLSYSINLAERRALELKRPILD
ncbi:uncharacterized protein K441DRAFT_667768, partial [Cenococcum geophilum 1.58]|uniref:uncharacterized protein n=1 Tax=Cenococcum geophilum 1.58 TaxID=794803 RepID=UPI00358FD182